MTTLPAVSVVLAACNHGATLRAVLDAIDRSNWPDLEIIAVDCGSIDDSADLLRARANTPSRVVMKVLQAPGQGRATALNMAIAAAGSREIVRLHADVVPDHPDWLQQLHRVLVNAPDCGIVGAKIVLAGGRIQSCGRNLINGLGIIPEWSDARWMEADRDEPSSPREFDGVSGEMCWIRRDVLDVVGDLDSNFDPVFGDDDDFCLRARWHGYRVLVEPAVRAVHYAPRATQLTPRDTSVRPHLRDQLDARRHLVHAHREYFRRKWGFDPEAPDLHEVRRRYGHTRLCWRIGKMFDEVLPEQPAVDVCFVTWNSRDMMPQLLDHLAATQWPDVRVWVTDNGSTDDTVAYLRERAATFPFPLEVAALPQNIGVAQGLNAAIARGSAPIVARLDDDAFVPPEWLERLIPRFHQRPFAGMVGPKVVHDNAGRGLQNGPTRLWPSGFPGIGARDAARVEGLARTVTIRGCCNLYRRSVFDRVGLFDVRFSPSQFDEWDHHIASAVAGYEAIYDGSVTVRHQINAGRMATPSALANYQGNLMKSDAKWGGAHWSSLDRALDLSNDGRFLPPNGDTSALYAELPPVPAGPPMPVHRDPAEIARLRQLALTRSQSRCLAGPMTPWWQQQVALCEHANRRGLDHAMGLVVGMMDLAPQYPHALMTLAEFRVFDGEHEQAIRTARWACQLAPDDTHLQKRSTAMHERIAVLQRPKDYILSRPATVLLLPPLLDHSAEVRDAVQHVAAALQAIGVACRIERNLVPDASGVEVVHAFGLREATALTSRLQVTRAMQPGCRIIVSSLAPDPARADWTGAVVGRNFFRSAAELKAVYAAAATGEPNVNGATDRRLRTEEPEATLDYERRCLSFVDALLCHSECERAWLASRHAQFDNIEVIAEGVASAAGDDASPELIPVPLAGVLTVGPRDLPGNHQAMVLALADCGVPLTLSGELGMPFGDWHVRAIGGPNVHLLPELSEHDLRLALQRSAVFLWLPSQPASFALPLQAALAGCELVLARDVGAEAVFGEQACYVDPHDLPAIRAATLRARSKWRRDPDQAKRHELARSNSPAAYGMRLAAVYGLGVPRGRTASAHPVVVDPVTA